MHLFSLVSAQAVYEWRVYPIFSDLQKKVLGMRVKSFKGDHFPFDSQIKMLKYTFLWSMCAQVESHAYNKGNRMTISSLEFSSFNYDLYKIFCMYCIFKPIICAVGPCFMDPDCWYDGLQADLKNHPNGKIITLNHHLQMDD